MNNTSIHTAMTMTAHNHPEAAERLTYPAAILDEIREAASLQTRLAERSAEYKSWSDAVFCEGTGIHGSTWGRIKAGKYPIGKKGTLAGLVHKVLLHARAVELRTRAAGRAAAQPTADYFRGVAYQALAKAVERCAALSGRGSEDRLVLCVGKPGMGKTSAARQLMSAGLGTWHIHALPSWARSYNAFLSTLARELGLDKEAGGRSARIELTLLNTLADRAASATLLVEEVEELGSQALSFLKALLNTTPVSVVLFMTPEFHAGLWRSRRGEARQLLRRQSALIDIGGMDEPTLRHIAPSVPEENLAALAAEAAVFGGYDFAKRVQERLSRIPAPTAADGQRAIAAARREQRHEHR